MRPTAEEFRRYVEVQESGVTNMIDVRRVMILADLSRETIFYIMEHYSELEREFGEGERNV